MQSISRPAPCRYHEVYRRHNYTTPKSFLELIALYRSLLARKRDQLAQAKQRLESGVEKIQAASAAVEDLQKNLEAEQIIVAEKQQQTQVGASRRRAWRRQAPPAG